MYELASCFIPYNEHKFDFNFQLQEAIKAGLRPDANISPSTPPQFLVLMNQAWVANPSDRPTFTEIVDVFEQLICD